MEEFIKGTTPQKLKIFITTKLCEYPKPVKKMFLQLPSRIGKYTPVERLAYILYKNNYRSVSLLKIHMKNITKGTMTIKSKVFHQFLLDHSKENEEDEEKKPEAVYEEDYEYGDDESLDEISL